MKYLGKPNNKIFFEIGLNTTKAIVIQNGWSGVLIDQNKAEVLLTKNYSIIFFPK